MMTSLWLQYQADQLALEAQPYRGVPGYELQLRFTER